MLLLVYVRMEDYYMRLSELEGKIESLCDIHSQGEHLVIERARRSVGSDGLDNLAENNRRFSSFKADSTGFRLYNTWASNTSVAQDHHMLLFLRRVKYLIIYSSQSSATVTPTTNHLLKFGDSMYSDGSVSSSRIKDFAAVSRLPVAKTKIANIGRQSSHSELTERTKFKRKHPKRIRLNWKKRRQDRKMKKKLSQKGRTENQPKKHLSVSPYNDKSVNRSKLKSRGLSDLRGKLLPAIHLHAAGARKEYKNKVSGDFTVRSWTPARWARKIKMDSRFLLEDGKLTVMSPGIYFVYAQINYLDSQDANAFQIVLNESPMFLCTMMTHKRKFSTKANTCYTGGVTFLEQGDVLFIKDLEKHRSAVMQSSHSFFGLAQLSGL